MRTAYNLNQPITPHMCEVMIQHYQQLLQQPNLFFFLKVMYRNSLKYWTRQHTELLSTYQFSTHLN